MSDLLEYKCPCCGGAIEFNSTLQKMKCPYCDTEFDMEAVKEFNEAAANQQSDELNWESASETPGRKMKPAECPFTYASPAAEKSLPMKAQVLPPAHSAAIR